MKAKHFAVALACWTFIPIEANAWFFFIIPGEVIKAVGDALTGSEGENCVGASATVGDRIRLPGGGVGTIKSLSGTSTYCSSPELPIRAKIDFSAAAAPSPAPSPTPVSATTTPKRINTSAGISLPDGWDTTLATTSQMDNGVVVNAINRDTGARLTLFAFRRDGVPDMLSFAESKQAWQGSFLKDVEYSAITPFVIGGLPAWRYHVTGTAYNNLRYTYLHSVIDAGTEVVLLSTWTEAHLSSLHRPAMETLAERITGFAQPFPTAAHEARSTSSTDSQAVTSMPSLSPTVATQKTSNVPTVNSAQRLRELNAVYREGLINQREYEDKKKAILDSM